MGSVLLAGFVAFALKGYLPRRAKRPQEDRRRWLLIFLPLDGTSGRRLPGYAVPHGLKTQVALRRAALYGNGRVRVSL